MTWQCEDERDQLRLMGIWEPLPPGYSPVLPTLAASVQSMPTQNRLMPLLMPLNGALPPFRDPLVGAFVEPQGRPIDLAEPRLRDPYLPAWLRSGGIGTTFVPGYSILRRLDPYHPALDTNEDGSTWPPDDYLPMDCTNDI